VGRLVQVTQIVNNAAREGARKASTGVNNYSDVSTAVTNYLNTAGITNLKNLQINVVNLTQGNAGPQYDPSQASQLDQLQVTVLLPFDNVGWIVLDTFTTNATQVTGQSIWYSNQDLSYPGNIVAPPGN
jgi:Flp pilus assembly protein TadG